MICALFSRIRQTSNHFANKTLENLQRKKGKTNIKRNSNRTTYLQQYHQSPLPNQSKNIKRNCALNSAKQMIHSTAMRIRKQIRITIIKPIERHLQVQPMHLLQRLQVNNTHLTHINSGNTQCYRIIPGIVLHNNHL